MSQNYLIPQFVFNFVEPFTHDKRFHHVRYHREFPQEIDDWLKSIGFTQDYLFYAIKRGFTSLPATCKVCGKPLTYNQLKNRHFVGYCSPHCSAHSPTTRERRKQTNLERYGVENSGTLPQFLIKREQTIKERYGSIEQSYARAMAKRDQTCIERYGTQHVHTLDFVKRKKRQTCLERYGVESSLQIKALRDDIKNHKTRREQYYPTFVEKLARKSIVMLSDKQYYIDSIATDNLIQYKCLACGHVWETTETNPKQLYCPRCVQSNKSAGENAIKKLVEELYHNEIVFNTRYVISPLELDVYLPKLHLAIEYNGAWCHSLNYSDRIEPDYHQNKTKACLNKNVRLIHIYDWEHFSYPNYVTNIIKGALCYNQTLVDRNALATEEVVEQVFYQFYDQYETVRWKNPINKFYSIKFETNVVGVVGFKDDVLTTLIFNAEYIGDSVLEYVLETFNWPRVNIDINYYIDSLFKRLGYVIDDFKLNDMIYLHNHIATHEKPPKITSFEVVDQGRIVLHKES